MFGAVLDGQESDASDLDILIDPTPETTLMDVAAKQVELQRPTRSDPLFCLRPYLYDEGSPYFELPLAFSSPRKGYWCHEGTFLIVPNCGGSLGDDRVGNSIS